MSHEVPTPDEIYAARLALQEIITCQVVMKDGATRDRLIGEGVEHHGVHLVRSAVGFINANAALEVEREFAENRFYYMLTRVGDLCELLAHVDDSPVVDVILALAGADYEVTDEDEETGQKLTTAIRAAQTCLLAHHFVRRGSAPWGIQQSLDLDDMIPVVQMLGHLLLEVADWFDEEHWADLVKVLLSDVEMILRSQARAGGRTVSEQVRSYFALVMTTTPAGLQ
ncbi:hypothetical protein [Pimelobacter simplex]|uniref:hypothetical protein n=1 Tax=Nocardioides simplex TaxID=2045 RepID=UPI001933FE84|nr:hypothetical protein [Pimelobacter simplex]